MKLKNRFCAFDVETTGLSDIDRIVSIGVAAFENGELQETWYKVINPGISIDAKATKIHGITNMDVQGKPEFKDVVDTFIDMLTDCTFITAYNISFDVNMISKELQEMNKTFPKIKQLDTLNVARRILKGVPNYKLTTVVKHLDLDKTYKAHDALEDAMVTGKALLQFSEDEKFYSLPEIKELHLDKFKFVMPDKLTYNKYSKETDIFRNLYSRVPAPTN